jgi:hypothetical protein
VHLVGDNKRPILLLLYGKYVSYVGKGVLSLEDSCSSAIKYLPKKLQSLLVDSVVRSNGDRERLRAFRSTRARPAFESHGGAARAGLQIERTRIKWLYRERLSSDMCVSHCDAMRCDQVEVCCTFVLTITSVITGRVHDERDTNHHVPERSGAVLLLLLLCFIE